MKNLVVTDRNLSEELFKNSVIVNLNNISYSPCHGGFGCLKRESSCFYKDDMSLISKWTNDCQLIIYITRVKYGCFDIPFKRMLERLIVNREPFYTMLEGQSCHLGISQLKKKLLVIAYGDMSDDEKVLFKDILDDTTLGYTYSSVDVYYCEEDEVESALKTFGGVDHV